MRVVVTGAAGYLGSVVCETLLDAGHEVVGVDSLRFGGRSIAGFFGRRGFSFRRMDLAEWDVPWPSLGGFDAVVHLAAIVGDPASRQEPVLTVSLNEEGTKVAYDAAVRAGALRFVFISTCSNYGRMVSPDAWVDETSTLDPLSVYASSKVNAERWLMQRPAEGAPQVAILRLATLFGASYRTRFDLTVNQFVYELLADRRLKVFGEQFWRPYVHVRDAARAIRMVVESEGSPPHSVWNVGSDDMNYRKQDLLEAIVAELGGDFEIERVHVQDDPRDYRVRFGRIRSDLGFVPQRSLRDGIEEIRGLVSNAIVGPSDLPLLVNS